MQLLLIHIYIYIYIQIFIYIYIYIHIYIHIHIHYFILGWEFAGITLGTTCYCFNHFIYHQLENQNCNFTNNGLTYGNSCGASNGVFNVFSSGAFLF